MNPTPQNTPKTLCRSRHNKMIAGVMGGIAERFDIDPTIARLIFVAVSVCSVAFPGIIVYIVLWLIMPKAPTHTTLPPKF